MGLGAVNDCGLLLSCAFELLELYFGNEDIYSDLAKIINGVCPKIVIILHLKLDSNYYKRKFCFR